MFFPNRFQQKTQVDDREITEFHGPPQDNSPILPSQQNQKNQQPSTQTTQIPIPRERRYSAPPPITPRLLPISTPPEQLRGSFFQVFKPTLDELKSPNVDKATTHAVTQSEKGIRKDVVKKEDSDDGRSPTPVSLLMLKTEF